MGLIKLIKLYRLTGPMNLRLHFVIDIDGTFNWLLILRKWNGSIDCTQCRGCMMSEVKGNNEPKIDKIWYKSGSISLPLFRGSLTMIINLWSLLYLNFLHQEQSSVETNQLELSQWYMFTFLSFPKIIEYNFPLSKKIHLPQV